MIKRNLFKVALVALLIGMVAFPAWAVPQLINYQGKLTDSGGNSLNGEFSMTFLIYNDATGRTTLWNETQSVEVIDGIYSVELGSVSAFPADLFDSGSLYLEVIIGTETLSPRQRLTSTAFSMKAGDADTVAGLTPPEIVATSHGHDGSDITTGTVVEARIDPTIARDSEITWGNLANIPADLADGDDTGITTETDPTVLASVKDGVSWGEVSGIPAGFADGVDDDTNTTYSAGAGLDLVGTQFSVEVPLSLSGSVSNPIIKGVNSSDGYGVHGESSSGSGVFGRHATTGNYGLLGTSDYGVYGYSGYSDKHGVYGWSTTGNGVTGWESTTGNTGHLGTTNYGVYGESSTHDGRGVYGKSSTGFGVHGESSTGYGVVGWSSGTSGYGVSGMHISSGNSGSLGSSSSGVYGFSYSSSYGVSGYSSDGSGVYGESSTHDGYGVYGKNAASGNHGYLGSSLVGAYGRHNSSGNHGYLGHSGFGVVGYSINNTGVYGYTDTGTAGYFAGPVTVTGYLTKSGGGFQIDHPLEPENKYLNHSFVESPDMKNIYDGVVVLDAYGERWVELPEWFEALNKDFRYQLTCIGGFAQVYIAQKIADNRFKIAGGSAGMEVSWQVTGIRQDPWAEANLKPVEEDKAADELGFYLSPETYGQPEEKGIEWGRNPEMMQRMKEQREKSVESKEPIAG